MTPKPPQHWLTALRETELFRDLDPEAIIHLGSAVREMAIAQSEALIRQGDEANSLFVVLSGKLEVFLERRSREDQDDAKSANALEREGVALHQIGPGAVVGEV